MPWGSLGNYPQSRRHRKLVMRNTIVNLMYRTPHSRLITIDCKGEFRHHEAVSRMLTNQFANQTESGSVIGEHLRVSLMAGRLPLGSRSAGPPAREPISPQLERFRRREVREHDQS